MNRNQAIPKTVDAYIAGFPPVVQTRLGKIRSTIKRAAPEATETISYGIPAFTLAGPLIYFAGFRSHISLYPIRATIRRHFKKELSRHLSGKATARFLLDEPVPHTLIEQIVKFRVKENLEDADGTNE